MYSNIYEIHVSISNKNETKEIIVDLANQYRLNRLRDFQARKNYSQFFSIHFCLYIMTQGVYVCICCDLFGP